MEWTRFSCSHIKQGGGGSRAAVNQPVGSCANQTTFTSHTTAECKKSGLGVWATVEHTHGWAGVVLLHGSTAPSTLVEVHEDMPPPVPLSPTHVRLGPTPALGPTRPGSSPGTQLVSSL